MATPLSRSTRFAFGAGLLLVLLSLLLVFLTATGEFRSVVSDVGREEVVPALQERPALTDAGSLRGIPARDPDVGEVDTAPHGVEVEDVGEPGLRTIRPRQRLGTLPLWRDDQPVYTVAFTPDGSRVLSAGASNVIFVRDLLSGRVRQSLKGHGAGIIDLAIGPGGRRMLSGGYDCEARLWDLSTGRTIRVFKPGGGPLYEVGFDAAGRRGVLAGALDAVWVVDLDTGETLQRLSFSKDVYGAAISRDDRLLAALNAEGDVRVWRLDDGTVFQEFHAPDTAGVEIAWGASDQLLTCGWDGGVKVWDLASGTLLCSWKAHDPHMSELALGPDGRRVVTGGWDGTVACWDLEKGEELWKHPAHDDYVVAVAYAPDGRCVASASRDGAVKLWDARTGERIQVAPDRREGHDGRVDDVLFWEGQPVTASSDGTIRIWDLERGEWTRLMTSPGIGIRRLVLHPDGRRVLACGSDGSLVFWDLPTGLEVGRLPSLRGRVEAAFFTARGARLCTLDEEGVLRLHDAETGNVLLEIPAGKDPPTALLASTDVAPLALLRASGDIAFLDAHLRGVRVEDAEEEPRGPPTFLHLLGTARDHAVMPGGRRAFVVRRSGEIALVEVSTLEEEATLEDPHGGRARCVAVDAGGRWLVTGGDQGKVFVWALED